MPAGNIEAMMTNMDIGTSIARLLAKRDSKLSQKDAPLVLSGNVLLDEIEYPLLDENNTPIEFTGVGNGHKCEEFTRTVAVKARGGFSRTFTTSVLVPPPLKLAITMTVSDNNWFTAETLEDLFQQAGMAVRLGTYRKRFGAFVVEEWNIED